MTFAMTRDMPAEVQTEPAGGETTVDSIAEKTRMAERLFEAFSARNLISVLELAHPEIVFEPMTAMITQAGEPYCGHQGLRRYIADVEERWQELTVEPVQIRAAGHAVVVLGLASGRGVAGSFENAPATWVLKFAEGLIVRIQIFSDARHVVAALGAEMI